MYKLIYYSNFKDINDNNIKIEIYRNTSESVTAKELLLSSDAIVINYNSENLLQPTKLSSATVHILATDVLTDLYTSVLNEISIKVFKNNNLLWYGFLSLNIYSSEYINDTNVLNVEFIDTVSQLEYIKYSNMGDYSTVRTFKEVLFHIFNQIDNDKVINEIWLNSNIKVNNLTNVLNELCVHERNFFDEVNEPSTCKKIVQEVCKFLSVSLLQFQNRYILIDYDSIKNNNNTYIVYNRTTNAVTTQILSSNTIQVNSAIFESGANVSLNDTYNKITLIDNINDVSDLTSDLINDTDLINQNIDPNKYYTLEDRHYTYLRAFFDSKSNWILATRKKEDGTIITEVMPQNIGSIYTGAFFQKNFWYKNYESDPSSISWSNYLTARRQTNFLQTSKDNDVEYPTDYFIKMNKEESVFLRGGFFIIDIAFMFSQFLFAQTQGRESKAEYTTADGRTFDDAVYFLCRLKIGGYYFNGEIWDLYQNYLDNISFYNQAVKKTKQSDNTYKYYTVLGGIQTEITKETYNKISCKDGFLLVHKNKEGDKCFDIIKTLDNQVSYKLDLEDAEEGALIPLPNFVLTGKLQFEICYPQHLGYPLVEPAPARGDQSLYWSDIVHIEDIKFVYKTTRGKYDIFNNKSDNTDIIFENVINESYINEFEDIELWVNTYNKDFQSYSYVICNSTNNFLDTVYNNNTQTTDIQEKHIVLKYYNYYKAPKFIYSNKLKSNDIIPTSKFYENTLNKTLVLNSFEYDISNDAITVNLHEL
jgi:hypothetical protein